MRLESYIVAELLQRWEQQGVTLRPRTAEIAAALAKEDFGAALRASTELTRVLNLFASMTDTLQEHVVKNDGLGELCESMDELALRARCAVIRAQFAQLRAAFRDPAVQHRACRWFVDPCRSFEDVDVLVEARITKIHEMWQPYRRGQPQPVAMSDPDRASIHRITVRVAQRALRDLRDEPAITRVLDRGAAAPDLTEVHMACTQINAVLGTSLDIESLPRMPRGTPRMRAINVNDEL